MKITDTNLNLELVLFVIAILGTLLTQFANRYGLGFLGCGVTVVAGFYAVFIAVKKIGKRN